MRAGDLRSLFDRQAEGYDRRWARAAPVRAALDLVVGAAFSTLPDDARILAVGVGTGLELAPLARAHPGWTFTAVDPSPRMIEACRRRAEEEGFAPRCTFHTGTLDTLAPGPRHHAATCFLVSQFITDRDGRADFFRSIADRVQPGGWLASADLASDAGALRDMTRLWLIATEGPGVDEALVDRLHAVYTSEVAVWSPALVADVIERGGFEPPMPVVQVALLHGWVTRTPAGERPA